MNLSEMKQEILLNYLDADLLVSEVKNPSKWSGGNQLMATSIFYILLAKGKLLTSDDQTRFEIAVRSCYVAPGLPLLMRNPHRPDAEAQDDYYLVCAASRVIGSRIALEIMDYAERHHYILDDTNPNSWNPRFWMGRFPGFIGHVRMGGNQAPGCLQKQMLSWKFNRGCSGKSDPDTILWAQMIVADTTTYLDEPVKYLKNDFAKVHGTYRNLFLPSYGKEHPFSQYGEYIT